MNNIFNATRRHGTVELNYVMGGIERALKGKRSSDNHWKLESEMNFIVLDGTYYPSVIYHSSLNEEFRQLNY